MLITVTSVKIKFGSYCEIMNVYEVIFTVHAAYIIYRDMQLTVLLLLTSVFRICKIFYRSGSSDPTRSTAIANKHNILEHHITAEKFPCSQRKSTDDKRADVSLCIISLII